MVRSIGMIWAVLLTAAGSVSAGEPVELGVKGVHVGEGPAEWKSGAEATMYLTGQWETGEPARAVEDISLMKSLPGRGGVVGSFAKLYPMKSRMEAKRFTRDGDVFTLEFEYWKDGGEAIVNLEKQTDKRFYLGAVFPKALEDGTYTVKWKIKPMDGSAAASEYTQKFVLPDPMETEWRAYFERVGKMSNEEVLAAFVENGPKGGAAWLTDEPIIGNAFMVSKTLEQCKWERTLGEIKKRGVAMVPLLLELLRKEAARNPKAELNDIDGFKSAQVFGFGRALMEMLGDLGDPRAVPLLLEILDGMRGEANGAMRRAARSALEQITMISFRVGGWWVQGSPYISTGGYQVPAEGMVKGQVTEDGAVASKYRQWLAGEGKDPAQWLALANARARAVMEGDDLGQVVSAVKFFKSARTPRDQDPKATVRRLAQILAETRWEAGKTAKEPGGYFYHGMAAPAGELVSAASLYGPLARGMTADFVRISGDNVYDLLRQVGGDEALAWLIGQLPKLAAQLEARHLEWEDKWDEHEGADRAALYAAVGCRWAIERWAGRTFGSPAEMAAWWEENREKSEEARLRAGIEVLAAQVDNEKGAWTRPAWVWQTVTEYYDEKGGYAAWLAAHRGDLEYVAERGMLRVK